MKLQENKFGVNLVFLILNTKLRKSGGIKKHKSDSEMSFFMKNKFRYGFKKEVSEKMGVTSNSIRSWCYGMTELEMGHALYELWKSGRVIVTVDESKLTKESKKEIKAYLKK